MLAATLSHFKLLYYFCKVLASLNCSKCQNMSWWHVKHTEKNHFQIYTPWKSHRKLYEMKTAHIFRLQYGCWTNYRGVSPQIIHSNKVFHEINHPFWGTRIFGNTHMYSPTTKLHLQNLHTSISNIPLQNHSQSLKTTYDLVPLVRLLRWSQGFFQCLTSPTSFVHGSPWLGDGIRWV